MKIGYIFSRYLQLSETFILREMWELERQGHEIHIFPLLLQRGPRHPRAAQLQAPVYCPGWLAPRSHLYWLRRRPGIYLRTLAEVLWRNRGDGNLLRGAVAFWGKAVAIAEQMQVRGIEHVHAHYATHPALAAYIVHRLTGLPYSFTVHAHDIFCHRAMLAEKLRGAQFVVAISEYNRTLLQRAVPPPRAPIHVVHCGIEWAAYARLAERRGPGAGGALRILSVGSLTASKGHRYLIEACAQLRQRGVRFHCRIAGGGEEHRRLRKLIENLALRDEVELRGPATEAEVAEALEWAEVFALPSVRLPSGKMEGLPVALMEAMAAGLAVVASRLSGIPELVREDDNGLLVPERDAAALARALWRLRACELRMRLGASASQSVRAGFELTANTAQLAALWAAGPAHKAAA